MELKKLAPNFAVQDIEKTVAFYRDVPGFKLEMAVPEDKSGVEQEVTERKKYIYAMMSRDGVEVMFQRMQEFYVKDCNGYILGFAERKYRLRGQDSAVASQPCPSGYITADKRKIRDFPKLPLATSFIRGTFYAIGSGMKT